MSGSEQHWIQREIERLTTQHGDIPPPWVFSQDSHPYSIEWRMGSGEAYVMVFHNWWEACRFDEGQRIAFFRKYPPPPCWLEWMIEAIWDVRGWEQDTSPVASVAARRVSDKIIVRCDT